MMLSQVGLTVDVSLREAPFIIVGTAGAALAVWAQVPYEFAAPTALAVMLRVYARPWRQSPHRPMA